MDFKTISWRSRWGLLQTPKEVSNSHILILKQEDLNHPLSAGGTAQQGTSKPGGVWSAAVVASWHRQWRSKQRHLLCWMSYWQTRSNWSGIWRPWAALAAVTRTLWNSESWGRNKTNKQTKKQNCYSGLQEKRLWTGQGVAWKSPTGHGPREESKSWLILRYHLLPSSGTVRLKSKRSRKARGQ